MLIFVDESGDFRRTGESEYQFGVAAAVIVPDHIAPQVEHAYRSFVSGLSPSEKAEGEPKGYLLADSSRLAFAELLGAFPDVIAFMVAAILPRPGTIHPGV